VIRLVQDRGAVFLLTDYGTQDEFAGVLRAVVQREAPGAPMIDLSHEVPRFDVAAGARMLVRCVPHLGPGVVLAVVDPGVGTQRRALAVEVVAPESRPRFLVGPDNGLLIQAAGLLGGIAGVVALPPAADTPSWPEPSTFDGRDRFAPAVAALWNGVPLSELGPPVLPGTLVALPPPRRDVVPGLIRAEVLWVDRFGNVQLATTPVDLVKAGCATETMVLTVPGPGGGQEGSRREWARRVPAFEVLEPGETGLVRDANGQVAIVRRASSAAVALGLAPGDVVMLQPMAGLPWGPRIPELGPGS
jgi:S-adenosylmethionine hydrolase